MFDTFWIETVILIVQIFRTYNSYIYLLVRWLLVKPRSASGPMFNKSDAYVVDTTT